MKNTKPSSSYPFIKNSILIATVAVPALSAISLFTELSLVKAEADLITNSLENKKLGTLRRIKSAVDSIEFLGLALSTQNNRALREKLIRNFMYAHHYFEQVSIIEAKNILAPSKQGNTTTKNADLLASLNLQSPEQLAKYSDTNYYNFNLTKALENAPKPRPKLTISKTIPGNPLWLLAGVIDSHDLLYPVNEIKRTERPRAAFDSFACIKTEEGEAKTIYRKLNEGSKEEPECSDLINKSKEANGVLEASINRDLIRLVRLGTSEASKIDLLGHPSRPHNLENINIELFGKIKSQDLNLFLAEQLKWSELGLFLVGITIFGVGHYGLHKAHQKEVYKTRLQSLASTDPLTGVWNRRAIFSLLEEKLREGNLNGHALLFLDIDNLKLINDSLGHDTGDKVICHVCQKISSCIRRSDAIGRLGGDEILIFLDNVGSNGMALTTAEKILKRCNEPLHSSKLHVNYITVSIGIASCRTCKSASEWVNCADLALYRAKKAGRNCAMTNDDDSEEGREQVLSE